MRQALNIILSEISVMPSECCMLRYLALNNHVGAASFHTEK